MTLSRVRNIIIAGSALWCAMILAAPMLASLGSPLGDISRGLYRLFSPVCHQIEDRSLHIFGWKLGVCSRCTAIYFAFLFSTAISPVYALFTGRMILHRGGWRFANPERFLLVAGILPMLADVSLDAVGLHPSSLETRLITGFFFGLLLSPALLPSLREALTQLRTQFRQRALNV